jgi:hypothetical protein
MILTPPHRAPPAVVVAHRCPVNSVPPPPTFTAHEENLTRLSFSPQSQQAPIDWSGLAAQLLWSQSVATCSSLSRACLQPPRASPTLPRSSPSSPRSRRPIVMSLRTPEHSFDHTLEAPLLQTSGSTDTTPDILSQPPDPI